MCKGAKFWWSCAQAAARGISPFANDWQWAIGNPTVAAISPAVIAGLAAWFGSDYVSAEHPILAPFALAFGAYIVTWVVAFSFRTLSAAPRLYYEQKGRADEMAERLTPKIKMTFDPNDQGCMHLIPEKLSTGKEAIIVRVLPECLTDAPINNCKGMLNGVYTRKSENDKWQKTGLRDSLSLSWSTYGHVPLTLRKKLLQYLDVGAVDEDGKMNLFVHGFQHRGWDIFREGALCRLDILITGLHDESTAATLSLQIRMTDQWQKPQIRILDPGELEIEDVQR